MDKILVIVPAYNEQNAIAGVIEDLVTNVPEMDILIVNDHSRDRTSEVARATGKAIVIDLPANLGIGGGVQTGFKFAWLRGYDYALQFDGDGQHLASEIPVLLELIRSGEADVVIGSRFCSDKSGFRSTAGRRVGIKIFEVVNSLIIKQNITDNTSGFRAYNRDAIEFLSERYPTEYPEPEAVVILGLNGFRIREVPAKMQERKTGNSSICGWKNAYYMVRVLLGIFMTWVRTGRER